MQLVDISRSKIYRFCDKCCVFLAAVDILVFFLYILGCYQYFLDSTRIVLVNIGLYVTVLLMGTTIFSLVLAMFFHFIRRKLMWKRIIFNVSFFVLALFLMTFFIFILTWAD
ncbi:MAG: hypothetical protein MJ215_06785 [Spirochaetia bacterium]|nr:hypothetical protein [Spirochaetia bacterium]